MILLRSGNSCRLIPASFGPPNQQMLDGHGNRPHGLSNADAVACMTSPDEVVIKFMAYMLVCGTASRGGRSDLMFT